MQTEMKETGRYERTLTVHLEEDELEAAKDTAARKLSKEMKIKGFRPGKAPRSMVERMVGAEALRTEAIEEAIPGAVGDALVESDLNPVTIPQVSDIRDRDGGGIEVDVLVTLWPTLEAIPDFSGREIEVELPSAEEEEIEQQVDVLRNQFATLEEIGRPADDGDFVLANITASLNGAEVEEASASDLLYEVGSESFIPGLDPVLLGVSSGDIKEGPGTLPPGFTDDAGAEVTLRVLVKEVRGKKLPELTDEFVGEVTEFESVEELREQIEKNVLSWKVESTRRIFQDQLIEAIVADLDLELPEALVEAEVEARVRDLLHRLEHQNISIEDYFRATGMDEQQFISSVREQSVASLSTRVLLDGVIAIDGIEVADRDYEEAVASLAASADSDIATVEAALSEGGQDQALTSDILRQKALARIVEAGTPVDANGNPVDLAPVLVDEEEVPDEEAPGQDESLDPEEPAAQSEE